MTTATDPVRSVRRPAEPTGDRLIDNAIHSIKTDIMDTEDRLIERMDERFDSVDTDLQAIKAKLDKVVDHLGIGDA
ncbi:MAG: hypothetical protein F4Y12_08805 [Acidimicrobiaceae bacterium]|nr:hypothetical protein [Acidimicrobiaceae bacterium]MYA85666.1 hypothetical protein [Acidimicrobiaceae bacterium]MYH76371.1 hypothetical protein [Acidimicrobiaceae bacterium]